jgi:hypothetical protein
MDSLLIRRCIECGKEAVKLKLAHSLCNTCYSRQYHRKRSETDPDFRKRKYETDVQWRKKNYVKYRGYQQAYYLRSHDTISASRHKMYDSNKQALLELLGSKCSNPNCLISGGCIDIRCLQFDHVNGGGGLDRKKFTRSSQFFRYYLNHPEEAKLKLQILCANCNWIKRFERGEHL